VLLELFQLVERMRKTVVFHLEQDLDEALHIGPRAEGNVGEEGRGLIHAEKKKKRKKTSPSFSFRYGSTPIRLHWSRRLQS
jgi:hypothetical protein